MKNRLPDMIKIYRKNKKLTQDELGDLLGLERQTISTYEQGTREPSISTLCKMVEIFSVTMDSLIFGDDSNLSDDSSDIKNKLEEIKKNIPSNFLPYKEISSNFNITKQEETKTTIIGYDDVSSNVVSLKENSKSDLMSVVIGRTGSGKTRSFLIPNILQCMNRGESVIINDPKGEIFGRTAGKFRNNGYDVKVLNFVQPKHSDYWNVIDDIVLSGEYFLENLDGLIDVFESFVELDVFMKTVCSVLLKAMILFVALDNSRSFDQKTIKDIYELLVYNDEKRLDAMFSRLKSSHPAKNYWTCFCKNTDNVKAKAIVSLISFLDIPSNQFLNNGSFVDTNAPFVKKCAYFIIPSICSTKYNFLPILFFDYMIKKSSYIDSSIPVNFIFEEICELGRIPNLPSKIGKTIGTNVKYMLSIQNIDTFKSIYVNDEYKQLLDINGIIVFTSQILNEYIKSVCDINDFLSKNKNKQVVVINNKKFVALDKYYYIVEPDSDITTYMSKSYADDKQKILNILTQNI